MEENQEAKDRQRLNLFVDADLHHRLKVEAAVRAVSMTSLVETALEDWLGNEGVSAGALSQDEDDSQ